MVAPGSRRDEMNALLARNWWAFILRGVAAILFGLVAFIVPAAAMLSLALLFAAYLLVDGGFAIAAAIRAASSHERWGAFLAEGILNLLMGGIALAFPAAAIIGFVLVTAAWAILTGGMMLWAAVSLHLSHGRWWLVFGGIVSVAWGVLLGVAPMVGATVLTWWLGAYAIVFGIVLLLLGFQLRRQRPA